MQFDLFFTCIQAHKQCGDQQGLCPPIRCSKYFYKGILHSHCINRMITIATVRWAPDKPLIIQDYCFSLMDTSQLGNMRCQSADY